MVLFDIAQTAVESDSALVVALLSGGGVAGSFIKMVVDKANMKKDITAIEKESTRVEKDLKEKLIEVTASKKAMKKELTNMITEKDQVLHARIDRVRDDNIKSYEKLEGKIEHLEKKYEENTTKILEALRK
jgi:gas vesicle protein